MSYIIRCEKCEYESGCKDLPKGYNLKRCPKCGGWLRFLFNYHIVPRFYRGWKSGWSRDVADD